MRLAVLLSLGPLSAGAAVVYDVATRAVEQSDLASISANGATSVPVVTRYLVEAGKVRIGDSTAKNAYLFKDRTMYVIDGTTRAVHVLNRATLAQATGHYVDTVKMLEDLAAQAPPEQRANAERKAADMKEVSDRLRMPVQRQYRVTVKFESVDGHACRVWEEREKDAKRLEICVAPAASIPGGAEILAGMKTLSQFRQGSDFAIGVDFGLSEWWPEVTTLNGVPILIREYKFDSQVSEVMLSGMHDSGPATAQFELPEGYRVEGGPDYVLWYVR